LIAMAAKKKRRQPRKHNPAAQAVRSPAYRPRVVKSRKIFSRKRKPPNDGE